MSVPFGMQEVDGVYGTGEEVGASSTEIRSMIIACGESKKFYAEGGGNCTLP